MNFTPLKLAMPLVMTITICMHDFDHLSSTKSTLPLDVFTHFSFT